jgi:hypothetical protein
MYKNNKKDVFGEPVKEVEGMGVVFGRGETKIKINDSQKELLDTLADIEHSGHVERFYKINNLKFKVLPVLEQPVKYQVDERAFVSPKS